MSRSKAPLFLVEPLPSALICRVSTAGLQAVSVTLTGELDVTTTPELEVILRGRPLQVRLVLVDLRNLNFIDVSGVYAIATASGRARETGRRVVVLRGSPEIDDVFIEVDPPVGVEMLDESPLDLAPAILRTVETEGIT